MKANYDSLFYTYNSNQLEILNIISDDFDVIVEAEGIPTEVNASKATSDTVKSDETKSIQKTNLITKVIERVKKLIQKIIDMFSNLKRKLTNRLRVLSDTDRNFSKLYYKRKSMVKPYKNIKVVTYQYVDQYLDRPMNKLLSEIVLCLDKLRAIEGTVNNNGRISEIINSTGEKMTQVLFQPYVDGSHKNQISSVNDFMRYLIERYRGEKKEMVYRDTQLPQIEAKALSTKELSSIFNGYLNSANTAMSKLKTLEYQIRRGSDEKIINLVASNATKASILYNTYITLISGYYELRLEQSLNYRIILRRFYQF